MSKSDERIGFLEDVFTCIVEDFGYNSWRQIRNYDIDNSTATIVVIEEDDDGMFEYFDINLDTVAKGINKLVSGEIVNNTMTQNITTCNRENDACNLDVWDADAILQAAIFEELVYG